MEAWGWEGAEKGFPNCFCWTWQLMVFRIFAHKQILFDFPFLKELFYGIFAWHRFVALCSLSIISFESFCNVIRKKSYERAQTAFSKSLFGCSFILLSGLSPHEKCKLSTFMLFGTLCSGFALSHFNLNFNFASEKKKHWARSQGKTHKHKLITQFKGALRAASKR